ncbi:MAG TPA: hypothetical protein VGY48_29875 [Vicinamibacterales bacterium]|nr:hypothetical protein [Vicinamibacterales bacterium]
MSPCKRNRRYPAIALVTMVALSSSSVRADVRADERAKVEFAGMLGRMVNMFGGKGAREGVTTTVAVKGDRKASINDSTAEIVDLSEEKVYSLDLKKKTYRVSTFVEMRQKMEDAREKASKTSAQPQKEEARPENADRNAPPPKQMEVDFDIKNTGEKRTVNGFDTHEAIVTITVREKGKTLEQGGGMVMTSDMWLAPAIKEMKEIRDFDLKYAQKLYGPVVAGASAEQMATAMAMYPMMKDAMAKMNAEGGRIDGTAIMTVTTMDAVKSEDQVAAEADAKARENNDQKTQDRSTVGSMLGGFAKRAAAKKMGGDEPPKARATFMTSTTEVLKVVTNVTADDVGIPAGFKESK